MIEKHKQLIKSIVDYPKKGIIFRDITPLLEDKNAFTACLSHLGELFSSIEFNKIACIEARGFLLGAALSQSLNKDLVLLRKAGKLPSKTAAYSYELEYGNATIEMHIDDIKSSDNVLIVDDLLATGGTVDAVVNLVQKLGGTVHGCWFLIELGFLEGRFKIIKSVKNYDFKFYSLIEY